MSLLAGLAGFGSKLAFGADAAHVIRHELEHFPRHRGGASDGPSTSSSKHSCFLGLLYLHGDYRAL
jgi:hypothetical protein